MKNWEINVFHTDHEEFVAWVRFGDFGSKIADIHLNKTWRWFKPPDNHEIRKSAFHEVCEVLLHPLKYLGESRFLTDSEMEPAVHDVIHVLENLLIGNGDE